MNELSMMFGTLWRGLPPLAAAVITLVAGWGLAFAARHLTAKVLKILRFDAFSVRVGFAEFLRKGGARYGPVELAGVLVYWVILAATFIRISRLLDFTIVQELMKQVRVILPSTIAAILILVVGLVIVTFLARFALTLARNAALPSAQAISTSIKYLGIAVVIAIALDQVGFGRTILGPMLLMLFGALVFGLALAFGLGCKDIARSAMERWLRELRERERMTKGTDLEG